MVNKVEVEHNGGRIYIYIKRHITLVCHFRIILPARSCKPIKYLINQLPEKKKTLKFSSFLGVTLPVCIGTISVKYPLLNPNLIYTTTLLMIVFFPPFKVSVYIYIYFFFHIVGVCALCIRVA